MDDEYLSTAEAATLLGVHRSTVLRLCESEILESRVYRYASRSTVRIPRRAIDKFIARYNDPSGGATGEEPEGA